MTDVRELRKLLAEEYGIHSDKELSEALTNLRNVNLGVFVAPMDRKDDKNGKNLCIA